MPDFGLTITTAAFRPPWIDETTVAAPPRLNPVAGVDHHYWRVDPLSTVRFEAIVAGVTGPLDAALGGRLFNASWAEWAGGGSAPILTPVAGSSSKVDAAFAPPHLGHFVLVMRRTGGGSILFHLDVEAP